MYANRRGRYRPPLKETPQYATLECLGRCITASLKQVAERLNYHPKTVYVHLRSLRAQGYVELTSNRRKSAKYMLTELGRKELNS